MSQSSIARSGTDLEARSSRSLSVTLKHILGPDWFTAYLFITPMVLLLGGLIAYPFVRAVYMSFTNTVSLDIGPFVGFDNYRLLYTDNNFWKAFRNTVRYTVTAVSFKFVLGLCAALLLARLTRWKEILTGLVLLPWIVPHVVIALTWRNLLDPLYGGVNQFLIQTGMVERGFPWLGDIHTAMPSVIMVNVWQGIPFFTIMMVAGVSSIDSELYEAASIDGANAWRKFLHVTLPGLKYVIIVAVLLSTIWTFNDFTTVFLLTGGGPAGATQLYSILAFNYAIGSLRYSMGVAVAVTMAPILAVVIFFLGRYMSAGGGIKEVQSEESKTWAGKTLGQRIGFILSWPFVMFFRLVMWVFWLIHDFIEMIVLAIGRSIGKLFGSGEHGHTTRSRKRSKTAGAIAAGVILGLLLLFELTPFYWVVITAFKTTSQWTSFESVFWPKPWSLEQFHTLFGPTRNFVVWYRNTIVVSVFATIIAVLAASLGAYGLTRLRWRGSNVFGSLVLVAYLVPVILLFIPHVPDSSQRQTDQLIARTHGRLSGTGAALCHLAADGLLRFNPGRAGERGIDRRLHPLPGLVSRRVAVSSAGLDGGCVVRDHTLVEGIHLRLCLPGEGEIVYIVGRSLTDDYRRCSTLG